MAYGDDWYLDCGREQLNQINAERAQELANLEAAKAAYDDHSAKAAIQAIVDLDAKRANLSALYSQYVASQNPPRPPEPGAPKRNRAQYMREYRRRQSANNSPQELKDHQINPE